MIIFLFFLAFNYNNICNKIFKQCFEYVTTYTSIDELMIQWNFSEECGDKGEGKKEVVQEID